MARIVYSMLVSLDGYIAAADGNLVMPAPHEPLHRHFNEEMRRTSVVICGRRMYEVMRVWDDWHERPEATEVEVEFARAWQAAPKLVFSTTLNEVGPNARLASDDVEAEVKALKARTEGEISASGAAMAASLARLGLIDEYRLYLQPVVLGGGKPFFEAGLALKLQLLGSETLPQEVTMLRYAPAT